MSDREAEIEQTLDDWADLRINLSDDEREALNDELSNLQQSRSRTEAASSAQSTAASLADLAAKQDEAAVAEQDATEELKLAKSKDGGSPGPRTRVAERKLLEAREARNAILTTIGEREHEEFTRRIRKLRAEQIIRKDQKAAVQTAQIEYDRRLDAMHQDPEWPGRRFATIEQALHAAQWDDVKALEIARAKLDEAKAAVSQPPSDVELKRATEQMHAEAQVEIDRQQAVMARFESERDSRVSQ